MGLPWHIRLECRCSTPALNCHTIVAKYTKADQVSDMVEFRHHHLTLPYITPADRIVNGVTTLTCALRDAPAIACNNHLSVIKALRQAIQRWAQTTLPLSKVPQVTTTHPTHTRRHSVLLRLIRLKLSRCLTLRLDNYGLS